MNDKVDTRRRRIKPTDAVTDYRDGFPYPPMTKALRLAQRQREIEVVVT